MKILNPDVIDFTKYLENPVDHANVKPASSYKSEIIDLFQNAPRDTGIVLPWNYTEDKIRIRPGELSIWAGINGHGKSLLLSMICLWQMAFNQKVCIASMEMEPKKTMYRMARQFIGAESAGDEAIEKFTQWTDGRLWIYDQMGTVQFDRMIALIRYCHEKLNIDQFVIDSLMKCGIGSDDYNQQKAFVDELSTLAKDTGTHIHLVAHSRKKESEYQRIGKFDIKGASEITDMADNVFTLWRDKKKEDQIRAGEVEIIDRPDCILVCDKQRHGEWEGKIGLFFHPGGMQFQKAKSHFPYKVPFA